jgi:hypothetical protein
MARLRIANGPGASRNWSNASRVTTSRGMDTYRITPHRGAYDIEMITANGKRRVISTHPTEEEATSRLSRLQRKGAALEKAQRDLRDWLD